MKNFKIIEYLKNIVNAKTLQEGLRPISIISAISGINPFTYDLSKTPKSHYNIPIFIYSICFYGIYVYSFVKVFDHVDKDPYFKKSLLLQYTFKFKIVLGLICLSTLIIEGFTFPNRYAVNLYNFVMVDKMIINLGSNIDYRILFKESVFIVVATQVINLVFEVTIAIVASESLLRSSWKLTTALYGPGYVSEMSLLFYGMFVYLVKVDIDRINKHLAQLCDVKLIRGMGYNYCNKPDASEDEREIKNLKTTMAFKVKMSKLVTTKLQETNKVMMNMAKTKRINEIVRIYDKICDITDGMYEAFSFKVLVIVTFCFISLVLNLFYVLSVVTYIFYGDYTDVLISFFCMSMHQGIMNMLFMVFICTACERCILRVIIL